MRFVYESGGVERDLELRTGRPDATVGDLAAALGIAAAAGLSIDGRECGADAPLTESGLVMGSRVRALESAAGPAAFRSPFVLRVVGGLDAGAEVPLGPGRVIVGRGRADGLNLASPLVSHAHCVIEVRGDGTVTVADLGSGNGTDVNGTRLRGPRRVGADDVIGLGGGAALRILPAERVGPVRHVNPVREARPGGTLPFTRPPRPAAPPPAPPITLPAQPRSLGKTPFSISMMLGPLIMAAGIIAITHDMAFAAFAALSPIMFITNFIEERSRGRFSLRRANREYAAAMIEAREALARRRADECRMRRDDAIDVPEAVFRAQAPGLRLWERRGTAEDHLRVSTGLADQLWIPPVALPQEQPDPATVAAVGEAALLPQVPTVVDLAAGMVGLEGDRAATLAVARALICQAVVASGPADVTLAVFCDPGRLADWDWTKWLPHGVDRRSGSTRYVAVGHEQSEALARALITEAKNAESEPGGIRLTGANQPTVAQPVLLAVVDGATLLEGRPNPLRDLLATGNPRCGGVVLTERLPALCASVVTIAAHGNASIRHMTTGHAQNGVLAGGASPDAAREIARALARFEDPELPVDGAGLPDQVTLLPLLGLPSVSGQAVSDRWRSAAESLRVRATLGVTERDLFVIDLDDDGPHGLIAGTTGSGKSELLRTLIAGMAVDAGPEHLTFVLVDYKGGGALDECARLPHVVGLVTDLDEQLGERALRCMEAELRHREHLLRDAGLGHVRDYQRLRATSRPDLEPMPRLVLVIDEFATLVKALPDFVDSLVSVAQRGRSLGMHLIMATQRPAGSVSDAIKNNVKLRIALRLESSGDSQDVIDDGAAARIGSRQWGRAYYRLSATDVLPVQTALSTGVTTEAEEHAPVLVSPFHLGMAPREHTGHGDGPTDLQRLVGAARAAQELAGIADPRRPWPEALPAILRLDDMPALPARGLQTEVPPGPAWALADDPDRQCQYPVRWDPGAGNILIYGAVGAGTTHALLSLALSLTAVTSPDRLFLYALDLGPGDLAPVTALPHTGAHVGASERERMIRLVKLLRRELDARKATGGRGMPDWLVLLDNISAFISEFDKDTPGMNLIEDLGRVYADGPAVGIRFAVTADRYGAAPGPWAALTQQKVVMRLADPSEFMNFEIKRNEVPAFVPGRAVVAATKQVVQLGWIGEDVATAVARVAARWPGAQRQAPAVGLLPASVSALDLGRRAGTGAEPWWLPLGVGDRTLAPVGVDLYEHEHMIIAGPQRSGRSLALCQIARAVLAGDDPPALVALAPRRSPLRALNGLFPVVEQYGELADALDAAGPGRMLLLVDDAETVEENPGPIQNWLAGAGVGRHLIAAGRAEGLRRAYGHWTQKVRESHTGILLVPDHELDGDLLGVFLPRSDRMTPVPGRGYLVADGSVSGIQLALHPDDGTATPLVYPAAVTSAP